jgi:hypothetical protein
MRSSPATSLTLPLIAALLAAACGGSKPSASEPCGACVGGGAAAAGRPVGMATTPKLKALAARRVELARKRLSLLRDSFAHGSATLDELFVACRDVAFAARDSGMVGPPLRDVLKEYRDAVLALRELTKQRLAKGAVGDDASARVEALVAEAEYWLEEASQTL